MKNDFEKLCDELENCNKKCENNPIICVRHYVNKYAVGNKDRLMRIKAEASSIQYTTFVSVLISFIGFLVAVFALFLTIFNNEVVKIYVVFATIGCSLVMLRGMKQFRNVRKYQSYILIVVDEELKNFN